MRIFGGSFQILQKTKATNLLSLLILAFLVVSIPVTVYLITNSRDDRSRAAVPNQADIDVIFIERTPRYQRYDVRYDTGYPLLATGTENLQRNPNVGQVVTFTAHYKNAGNLPFSSFGYKWYIDNVEVKSGTAAGLAVGVQSIQTLQWAWQTGDHTVRFVADPPNLISEISEDNNILEDRTNAIYLRMQVEQSVYDNFNQLVNLVGTYSFEDWVQEHMKALNQKLIDSGSIERVRIDQIQIQANDTLPNCCTHADVNWEWDGSWGFSWAPDSWCMPGNCNSTGNFNDITYWITRIQPGLIHEWTHQMGMAHSYDANVDNAADNQITGKKLIQVKPEIVGAKRGDDVGYSFVDNVNLTPYFVKALNSNKGYRRGYYADYLFDIPDTNKLIIKDALGNLLSNAQIKIWQTAVRKLSGSPRFIGTTDAFGEYTIPNQTIPFGTLTTSTGHTLKANPFGIVHVVGENGLFLIEISVGTQKDYKIMTVHDFNMAYWSSTLGSKNSATYVLNTEILLNANPENIALGKTATASKTSSQAAGAVDGDKTSITSGFWEPAGGQSQEIGGKLTLVKTIRFIRW